MSKNLFAQVSALLSSQAIAVEAANAFDRAYEGGKYHEKDFESDSPNVPINLAGLYATTNAAFALATLRDGDDPSEEAFLTALEDMKSRRLVDEERTVAMLFANATWAAGQWFRAPKRVERIVFFPLLPEAEKIKDVDQFAAGAQFLLERIS